MQSENELRSEMFNEIVSEALKLDRHVDELKDSLKEAFDALCFAGQFTTPDLITGRPIPFSETTSYMRALASIGKHFQQRIHLNDPTQKS